MKKYMLIVVCDREIEAPRFFETIEDAQKVMWEDFSDTMGIGIDEAKEKYMNDEWNDDCQMNEYSVSADVHHMIIDWQIFDMSKVNCLY